MRKNQVFARQRVLEALQGGSKTSAELNQLCFRYGARIFELRKNGYHIKTKR
ncbi:MAG: helix-turn-helix domain-containing protein, partial [Terriglobia bacterium]